MRRSSSSRGDRAEGLRDRLTRDAQATDTRMHERWRRIFGLLLLAVTVVLWTVSNFLASTIFADDTYSKPFLVTYLNSSSFIVPLIPMLAYRLYRNPSSIKRFSSLLKKREEYAPLASDTLITRPSSVEKLSFRTHALIALEICLLWYASNYFVSACLEYTTVSSSTILTSTSSIFTLFFGYLSQVELFTKRKLLAVLASLAGIALVSTIDLSGRSDEGRGSFPHKTPAEIGLGDAMALVSAVMYGLYAVRLKVRVGDERRADMPLLFGLVGVANAVLLWPGFFLLHWTGLETFELPPDGRVWWILIVNAVSSTVSDFAWAYALLLTSPIVVTVGLSTTIPLSLIGQLVIHGQTAGIVYWLGAIIVVASFVVVNHEEDAAETHGPLVKPDNEDEDQEAVVQA